MKTSGSGDHRNDPSTGSLLPSRRIQTAISLIVIGEVVRTGGNVAQQISLIGELGESLMQITGVLLMIAPTLIINRQLISFPGIRRLVLFVLICLSLSMTLNLSDEIRFFDSIPVLGDGKANDIAESILFSSTIVAIFLTVFVSFFSLEQALANLRSEGEQLKSEMERRRRSESERAHLAVELSNRKKLESLGVLAGGIAHDFNGILTRISCRAGILLESLPPSSQGAVELRAIEAAVREGAELSSKMVDYSGKGKTRLELINLSDFVQERVSLLKTFASEGVDLQFHGSDDLPKNEVDPNQIENLLSHMVRNASESIPGSQGTITINVGTIEIDSSWIEETHPPLPVRGSNYVYLRISDTGVGMNEETRNRLFDPFFSTKETGRGLGMSVVLGIVRGHGGLIKVESRVGEGTTIWVLFSPMPVVDTTEDPNTTPFGVPGEPKAEEWVEERR